MAPIMITDTAPTPFAVHRIVIGYRRRYQNGLLKLFICAQIANTASLKAYTRLPHRSIPTRAAWFSKSGVA